MPAPRAILIDIMKLGLDPKKPHASLNKNGRLSQKIKKDSTTKKNKEVVSKVEVQDKKEVKLSATLEPQEKKKTVEVGKVEVETEDNQQKTNKETFQLQEEVKVEVTSVQEKVVESQKEDQSETKLEEVIEENKPSFQVLSQQDKFLKKKNALKKV